MIFDQFSTNTDGLRCSALSFKMYFWSTSMHENPKDKGQKPIFKQMDLPLGQVGPTKRENFEQK